MMAVGVDGILFTVMARVCCPEVPHPLLAETLMVPPVLFEEVLILLVEGVPAQPDGKVHVYNVAPFTAEM